MTYQTSLTPADRRMIINLALLGLAAFFGLIAVAAPDSSDTAFKLATMAFSGFMFGAGEYAGSRRQS